MVLIYQPLEDIAAYIGAGPLLRFVKKKRKTDRGIGVSRSVPVF